MSQNHLTRNRYNNHKEINMMGEALNNPALDERFNKKKSVLMFP